MMTFPSIEAYVAYLETRAAAMIAAAPVGVEAACKIVLEATRENVGTYQRTDTFPFEPWAELAEETKQERVRLGYSENDPLLREGDLRDSYGIRAGGFSGAVGSESMIAFWQEFGTEHIPARSHVGMAAARNGEHCADVMARPVIAALAGGALP